MFNVVRRATLRLADFAIGRIAFELEREKFQSKRIKFLAGTARYAVRTPQHSAPAIHGFAQARGEC